MLTTHSRSCLLCALAALALPLAACAQAPSGEQAVAAAPPTPSQAHSAAPRQAARARNVILFIGDGMGISTVTAARIHAGQKRGQSGEENLLSFEQFKNVALVKTYNTDAQVPDSAGTASAIQTGVKTRIGVISVGPEVGHGDCALALAHRLETLGERARAHGKALGIVTTTRITHATPATVYAHSPDRDWEVDSAMSKEARAAGCKDIAAQLVESDFDVALGGGRMAFFGPANGGRRSEAEADLVRAWRERTGGVYVESRDELAAAPRDLPLLGLFADSHLDFEAQRTAESRQPSLVEMTAAAIERLSRDPQGFYLMVEGGRIDHAHHAGRAGLALEETIELARAVEYALAHTSREDTLILVTADHSHVFTMAGYPRRGNPILGLVVPPGSDSPRLASDGLPYATLGYANGPGAALGKREMPQTGLGALQQATVPLESETHGGEDVALYATGPGAEAVRGVMEQNRIYHIIARAMGWQE